MEKSNKRGKIPQSDWPLIMARYEAGETLVSIARTYDCSSPAISYIVGRNRDKSAAETPVVATSEPQLIKAHTNGAETNGVATAPEPKIETEPTAASPSQMPQHRNGADRQASAATPQPSAPAGNTEPRPKLHLGFGNGHSNSNGHGNGAQHTHPDPTPRPFQAPPKASPFDNGAGNRDFAAPRPLGQVPPQMPRDDASPRKDSGAAIDRDLRSRIDGDITAFLAAFDAVLAGDTLESRSGLREATDRLLRVGARTRIELERLEAKAPLPPRDGGTQAEPGGWRYR